MQQPVDKINSLLVHRFLLLIRRPSQRQRAQANQPVPFSMRDDEAFAPLIIEDAEMLGVDAFGDSAVVIKFLVKTRPLKQWAVKRELLRRIKNRFDELGIEIPFPHRTVYHRNELATPEPEVEYG